MDAAVAGLLGVAFGVVGTGATTIWLESRRWSREDRNRWLDARLPAYGAIFDSSQALLEHSFALVMLWHARADIEERRDVAIEKGRAEHPAP